jgi:hypothetical protein
MSIFTTVTPSYADGRAQVRRCELVLAASPFRSVSCGHFLWGPSPLVRAVAEDSPLLVAPSARQRRLDGFCGFPGLPELPGME